MLFKHKQTSTTFSQHQIEVFTTGYLNTNKQVQHSHNINWRDSLLAI